MSKASLITVLRDQNTGLADFRLAAIQLSAIIAAEVAECLPTIPCTINTPLGQTQGQCYKRNPIIVPILRAGLAFLSAFMTLFPKSKIGMIGAKRDEVTAIGHEYYRNLPAIGPEDDVVVLDPMIATGGSSTLAVRDLINAGALEENIYFAAAIAAPEGLSRLSIEFPKVHIVCAQVDQCLNHQKFIVPGLGDFGDRFFGTE